MTRSKLIENDDYQLAHVRELRPQGGTTIKNVYLLKPKAFKKLLLDIHVHEQRIKFRDYYILLEECVSYYDDYQIKINFIFLFKLFFLS